jgi:hypothetical protein
MLQLALGLLLVAPVFFGTRRDHHWLFLLLSAVGPPQPVWSRSPAILCLIFIVPLSFFPCLLSSADVGCTATVFNCSFVVQACFIAFLFPQPLCKAKWVCSLLLGFVAFP